MANHREHHHQHDGQHQQQAEMFLTEVPLPECTCRASDDERAEAIRWTDVRASWTRIAVSPSAPAARGGHTCVFIPPSPSSSSSTASSPSDGSILLFGGSNRQAHFFNDLYSFDIATRAWTLLAPATAHTSSSPCPRAGHIAAFDAPYLYVYGGQQVIVPPNATSEDDLRISFLSDVWRIHVNETCGKWRWERLSCTGTAPERNGACGWISDGALWVLGGSDRNGPVSLVHRLDLKSLAWSSPNVTGDVPEGREMFGSASLVAPSRVLITGGRSENGILTSSYLFDSATLTWHYAGRSAPRCSHTLLAVDLRPSSPLLSSSALSSSASNGDSASSASPAASASSAALFLSFGGTDGLTFFSDLSVLSTRDATNIDAWPTSEEPCATCNGPRGWHRLGGCSKTEEEGRQQQEQDEGEEQAGQEMDADTDDERPSAPALSKSAKKRNRRKRSAAASAASASAAARVANPNSSTSPSPAPASLLWPSPRFAHAMCLIPATASSSSPPSPTPSLPSLFLFAGLDQHTDAHDTWLAQLQLTHDHHPHDQPSSSSSSS